MTKITTRQLVLAALFLALGILLPIAFHWLPGGGKGLSPMHIPVLLCGFVCGWPLGLAVGALTPVLSSVFTGMPPMGATFMIAMIPELAIYGLLSGFCYQLLPKNPLGLYASLIPAMLGGRIVYGIAMWLQMLVGRGEYSLQLFLAGAFVDAVPAIILHIVAIPPLVLALKRAKLMPDV